LRQRSKGLLRAIRARILDLVQHIPDAWERGLVDELGRPWGFERYIGIMVRHALEHADEIREIQHVHGR
jgi:hypothetical protein